MHKEKRTKGTTVLGCVFFLCLVVLIFENKLNRKAGWVYLCLPSILEIRISSAFICSSSSVAACR